MNTLLWVLQALGALLYVSSGVMKTVLSAESLVFIGVHVKYREIPPIVFSAALGVAMGFVAYGRLVLVR